MNEDLNKKLKELEEKLERCEKVKDEYLAGWQRQKADFINYKKEENERRAHWAQFVATDLINDLLLVLDSFDLARTHNGNSGKDLEVIRSQFESVLKKRGLEEIKALGEKFDPLLHETIGSVEDPEKPEETVIEVSRKGYTLNGRVLRPAKVKITTK